MSRSGYTDYCEGWDLIRWRGAVESAIRGKRGQAFMRELAASLDAMPEKKLVAEELVTLTGDVCAMGAVCKARGLDVSNVDPYEPEDVAALMGLAPAMVQEIAFVNDDYSSETPERRWVRMREWVTLQIAEPTP